MTQTDLVHVALLELALLTTGIAQGFVVAPLIAVILARVTAEESGAASGTIMTTSNAAVSFGVAGLGGVSWLRPRDGAASPDSRWPC